jgi:hypothetical protein
MSKLVQAGGTANTTTAAVLGVLLGCGGTPMHLIDKDLHCQCHQHRIADRSGFDDWQQHYLLRDPQWPARASARPACRRPPTRESDVTVTGDTSYKPPANPQTILFPDMYMVMYLPGNVIPFCFRITFRTRLHSRPSPWPRSHGLEPGRAPRAPGAAGLNRCLRLCITHIFLHRHRHLADRCAASQIRAKGSSILARRRICGPESRPTWPTPGKIPVPSTSLSAAVS